MATSLSTSPAYHTRLREASPRRPLRSGKEQKEGKKSKDINKKAIQNDVGNTSGEEEDDRLDDSASSGNTSNKKINVSDDSFQSDTSVYYSPLRNKEEKDKKITTPKIKRKEIQNVTPESRSPISRQKQSPAVTRERRSSNKERDVQTGTWYTFGLLAIIVLILAISYTVGSHLAGRKPGESVPLDDDELRKDLFNSFRNRISGLENVFTHQNKKLWQTIKGSMRSIIIDGEPRGPAVLLFVIPSDQDKGIQTSKCIGQKIVNTINDLYNRSNLDHVSTVSVRDDLQHKGCKEDKAELDDKLIECFKEKSKGVTIEHLEELSPLATLLLHGYCDGDNAPHKDVVFVLLLRVEKTMTEVLNTKHFADKYLTELWKSDLDQDRSQPLLSRIANNVAVISSENAEVLKTKC